MPSLSPGLFRRWRALTERVRDGAVLDQGDRVEAGFVLQKLPARRAVKAVTRERVAKERAERKDAAERRSDLRERCMERDGGCSVVAKDFFGHCEGGLHMDHQWGRGKVPESLENCRMLCARHDLMKTRNEPARVPWIVDFEMHARKYGYERELAKCDAQIALEQAQHPAAARSGAEGER